MIKIIVGFLICLFGVIGFAAEIEDYFQSGEWDYFNLTISAVLIYAGGALFYYSLKSRIRKKQQ
jgi:hypothetical protein